MDLLELCRKASARLSNETKKNLEKCTKLYKNMHQFYERFHLASAAKINDFMNKYQLVMYLHDRLHEDEQYIQKMEVISEDNVKNWIAQSSTNNYILEYLFRTNLEKVINVESQLVIH